MSGFDEYDQFDALGLAELVTRGDVTPVELLDEAIARRDAVNPELNLVIRKMDDIARETVRGDIPDGPFRGVPFLIKDLMCAWKGVPLNSGSRAYKDYVPDFDSEMVIRYKKAGLVVFGKTNTPELGIMGETNPNLYGPSRNPWNPERTTGGSSGGSSGAVAAGILPMASGGDGGGSLRIPGSCCGIVGMKPSRGRNPFGPAAGDPWYGQVQEGVLSRSVRDTAAALDATQGPDIGCPYAAPVPQRPFLEEVGRKPGKLRIAWSAQPLMRSGELDEDCITALHETVALLKGLGHELIEADPPVDRAAFAQGYLKRIMAATAGDIAEAATVLGRKMKANDFEPETWLLARLGQSMSAAELDSTHRVLQAQSRVFCRYLEDYDVFLTPTLGKAPEPHGHFKFNGAEKLGGILAGRMSLGPIAKLLPLILPQLAEENFNWVTSTPMINITGNPSVSLPLAWNKENLPIGMMFTARYLDDAVLFRLAGQLEKEQPWWDQRPPIWAGK